MTAAAACGELVGATSDTTPSPGADAAAPPAQGDDEGGVRDGGADAPGDAAADAPMDAGPRRYVFVSPSAQNVPGTFGTGDGGPYAVADKVCNDNKDKLPGVYAAFLKGMAPLEAGAPWYLPKSGVPVFGGTTPPTPGGGVLPAAPIDEGANGDHTLAAAAWTGADGVDCVGWTSSVAKGDTGDPLTSTGGWDDAAEQSCGFSHVFYCFER